ncbi:hypothetical protein E3N88_00896 [Mikania micrantha]|uniref:Retrotransposon gag domain-containing protein n=1 Tax=Mikania micrantha TaxID=192012 RepID=A0A5N6Q243_9ASTR|nr:hypothetical protein E3N88_00896 [Mikania micrantha]
MVNTRSEGSGTVPDPVAAQLAAIASSFESLKADVAALKHQSDQSKGKGPGNHCGEDGESSWNNNRHFRPYNKIDFPTFNGGDPRGWVLKAEKYFRYYQIPEEEQVDVASMHLEGDALDLFSWLSTDQPIQFWDELVHAFQRNFGPAEFQNPDEHLCSVRQTGSVQEYRQEFAKRSSRVTNWPDHCLLGVFLNGLKDEFKADVRIHKPQTVYKAMSLALENESKMTAARSGRSSGWNSGVKTHPNTMTSQTSVPTQSNQNATKPIPRLTETEKQNRYLRGECFRCGDKYGPGHRCKVGTFKLLEAENEGEEPVVVTEEEPKAQEAIGSRD